MKNITYISAGAGSGKTYTLTNILAELISKGEVQPEQVILTTFSISAAADFKERAKAELYKRGKYDEASRLDQALIGTIDSVANSLIAKYWYAIGLAPKNGTLTDDAKAMYINQSLAAIASDDDLQFFARFKTTFVLDRPAGFAGNNAANQQDDYWKKHLKEIVDKSISFHITDYEESLENSLATLKSLCRHTDIHTTDNERRHVIRQLDDCFSQWTENATRNKYFKQFNELKAIARRCDDIEWCIRLNKVTERFPQNLLHSSFCQEIAADLVHAQQVWQSNEAYNLQEQYVRRIFALADKWNKQFAEFKKHLHIVDFTDMEHYMLLLLQDDEVAAEVGRTYTHVFVDEFQDCSPMQVQLFRQLAGVVRHSYWVGDTKQAIYGFRGSDTALTKAVGDSIGLLAQADATNGCSTDTLKESWRSVPALVNAVNATFVKAFEGLHLPPEQIELTSAMETQPQRFDTPLSERPACPLRFFDHTTKDKSRAANQPMGDLARYILQVSRNEHVPLSQIAVLAYKHNSLNAVQAELDKLGVACGRQELLDPDGRSCQLVIALLSYLLNPRDDQAKAIIAHWSVDGMGMGKIIDTRLDYLADNAADNDPGNWLGTVPLVEATDRLRQHVREQGIGAMVETLVVELDLKNLVARWNDGRRHWAELKALVKAAKDYEGNCQQLAEAATPTGFAAYLSSVEVKVAADPDGVVLSTVHGAKGLQWRYVFFLVDATISQKDVLKNAFYGLHNYYPEPPSADNISPTMCLRLLPWIFGSANSNVPDALAETIYASEMFERTYNDECNENARLFYVVMTRPKEVFTLVPYKKKNPLEWLHQLHLEHADETAPADVLGVGAPFVHVRAEAATTEAAAPAPSPTCTVFPYKAEAPCPLPARNVQPSSVKGVALQVEVLYRSHERIPINSSTAADVPFADIGTCIHDVFAAIEQLDQQGIQRLVEAHGLATTLTDTTTIMRAWESLNAFLEKTYGPAVATFHERAFRHHTADGRLVVGSIDYVYETSEGCVLVDFKTFPQEKAAFDPASNHFAGRYAGQLDTYEQALTAAGNTVRDRLISYPVTGLVVRVAPSEAPADHP